MGPGAATRPAPGTHLGSDREQGIEQEMELSLELREHPEDAATEQGIGTIKLLREVLLNPASICCSAASSLG
ncbi:hypothetical protein I553_7717 [Mycobacterium xenopi 4042]|uniref:Uncharacterized protein n=1 Tax=Mycobacterium xenopi 4042 TaxID=1299334 RepID=X8AN54_MYCXE|nr:hypothetical protein I553_7717 [Mycobacterium xenopi 4042]